MHKDQEKKTTWYIYNYAHANFIIESGTVLCGLTLLLFLSYISGPCDDLFELQDDIAHSEVQDSLMCSPEFLLLV